MNVLMPQLGETVTEGTIGRWYKNPGERIAAGENLFEIETDKTVMDVPAISPGVLSAVHAKVGQTVPVGSVVAIITEEGEVVQSPGNEGTSPVDSVLAGDAGLDPFQGVRTPTRNHGKATLRSGIRTTPLARRLASQMGVDIERVRGTGPHGRIVAADIRRAAVPALAQNWPEVLLEDGSIASGDPGKTIAIDGMRGTIAQRLVESKPGIPHFYLKSDVGVDSLLALRTEINAVAGVKVSVNDLIVKAFALALQRVPEANRIWSRDGIVQFVRSDVGVAVSTDGGLITPIVRNADLKSISDVATEIRGLAERGRARRLRPEEYQGGVATVSNLGMYGITEFSAIINPPQSTILAVGAAERRVEVDADGEIRVSTRMTLTLSVDHRVLDGATAAQLLSALRTLIEKPVLLLI